MNALPVSDRALAKRRAPAPPAAGWGMSGALAGLAGGVMMMITSLLVAGWYGYDIWFQLKAIASLLLGSSAVAPAGFVAGPVLLGLALHLLASVLLGVLFAFVAGQVLRLPSDYGAPAVGGLMFGLLIWLVAYLAVPVLIPQLMAVYAPNFIIQHIVYGTATGMIYAALRPSPYALAS